MRQARKCSVLTPGKLLVARCLLASTVIIAFLLFAKNKEELNDGRNVCLSSDSGILLQSFHLT